MSYLALAFRLGVVVIKKTLRKIRNVFISQRNKSDKQGRRDSCINLACTLPPKPNLCFQLRGIAQRQVLIFSLKLASFLQSAIEKPLGLVMNDGRIGAG